MASAPPATQRGREVSQLNLQYFGEELIVPSGALPLSFEAVCGGMMLSEADGDPPHPRKIVGQGSLANATGVFVKQDVQLPVAVVFNRPVLPYGSCEVFACQVLAENIITHFFGHFVAFLSDTDDHTDGLDARPVAKDFLATWDRCHVVITIDLTAACQFAGVMAMATAFRPVSVYPMVFEERFDRIIKCRLIAFDGDHESPFLRRDLSGDLLLTTRLFACRGASIVTMASSMSIWSSNSGIAVISLDFSSVATCPREI